MTMYMREYLILPDKAKLHTTTISITHSPPTSQIFLTHNNRTTMPPFSHPGTSIQPKLPIQLQRSVFLIQHFLLIIHEVQKESTLSKAIVTYTVFSSSNDQSVIFFLSQHTAQYTKHEIPSIVTSTHKHTKKVIHSFLISDVRT